MIVMKEPVTAQQLAELADETYDTIDYWSEKGLLTFQRKGRRRLYSPNTNLRLIKKIRSFQNKGHSLDGIRDNLSETT